MKARPNPISAMPEPPSKVEKTNWLAAASDGFNSETNAVTGTLKPSMEIPLLLFADWHLLALSGKVLTYPVSNAEADVVRPVT